MTRALFVCCRGAIAAGLAALVLAAHGQEKVVLDGSSGMLALARSLAAAYQAKGGGDHILVGTGLGTAARLPALAQGKVDVVLASHGLDADEVRARKLRMLHVAKGAVVFAVNRTVDISRITEAQACDVYSGRTTDWSSFAASSAPIAVFSRPPTEVDPEVIRAKVGCFRDLKESVSVKVMARGPDMAKALAETPFSIGMTSMTVAEQSAGRVKALALADAEPTAENVKSGRYPLTRDFFFVLNTPASAAAERFLNFVLSAEGDRVIIQNGAVPLR
jgi:phosphate transport system substrate-binding protein